MSYVEEVFEQVKRRDPEQKEFHQAVWEVMETIEPVLKIHSEYRQAGILERMVEPDRIISFKVPWVDDNGNARVNRGMRVQFNNSNH